MKSQNKNWIQVGVLLLMISVVSGCGGSDTKTEIQLTENDLIQSAIDGDPTTSALMTLEAFSEDANGTTVPAFKAGVVEAPIPGQVPQCPPEISICWYREMLPPARTIDTKLTDGLANATITANMKGTFFIKTNHDGGVYGRKTISAFGTRYATFQKVEQATSTERRRELKEVSPMNVTSLGTIEIAAVTIAMGANTRTIKDPAEKMTFPTGIPTLTASSTVTISAIVAEIVTATPRVYLHRDGKRKPMVDRGSIGNGRRSFSVTDTTGTSTGFKHIVIDAISGNVFSNETSQDYSANAWVIPYQIR